MWVDLWNSFFSTQALGFFENCVKALSRSMSQKSGSHKASSMSEPTPTWIAQDHCQELCIVFFPSRKGGNYSRLTMNDAIVASFLLYMYVYLQRGVH
ncbi:hypothetical protein E4T56_gene4003 [Termitomyces sp. T112]|nr:hypothetical protein E4T56_gene4003 [Termitomyces sp. T112]